MLQFDLTTFVRRRRLPQFLRISVPPRAIPYTGHPTQKVLDTTPSSNRHSSVSSWGVPGPAQFHAMHNSETIVLNLGGHTRTRESSAALASRPIERSPSIQTNQPRVRVPRPLTAGWHIEITRSKGQSHGIAARPSFHGSPISRTETLPVLFDDRNIPHLADRR
jgi:hypothetical protein